MTMSYPCPWKRRGHYLCPPLLATLMHLLIILVLVITVTIVNVALFVTLLPHDMLFETLLPLLIVIVIIFIVVVINNLLFAALLSNKDVVVVDVNIVTIAYDTLLATLRRAF